MTGAKEFVPHPCKPGVATEITSLDHNGAKEFTDAPVAIEATEFEPAAVRVKCGELKIVGGPAGEGGILAWAVKIDGEEHKGIRRLTLDLEAGKPAVVRMERFIVAKPG